MGLAVQIQVRGELDGSTAFVWPSTLPTPVNGVHIIDAGAGVDVGRISLEGVPSYDTLQGYWLKAFQVETSAATRALRCLASLPYQSITQQLKLHHDLGVTPEPGAVRWSGGNTRGILSGLRAFTDQCLLPPGASIDIATDSVDCTFAGVPVAGPHFIYLEIEPIRTSREYNLVQQLSQAAKQRWKNLGNTLVSAQAVAASSSDVLYAPLNDLDRWTGSVGFTPQLDRSARSWQLRDIYAATVTALAVGESMQYEVFKRNASGSNRIGALLLDNTNGGSGGVVRATGSIGLTNAVIEASNCIDPGDQIVIDRTYVAGGGPTMTDNALSMRFVPFGY